MTNINLLIEVKKEYTEMLHNILTPVIYDGIKSIYNKAKKSSDNMSALKTFQILLKNIPKWSDEIIQKEVERIITSTVKYSWFIDLLKAVFKANLSILTVGKIDESVYNEINMYDFIHNIYIECAREFWNNPFLLFDEVPPIDQQRNKLLSYNLIEKASNNALRKSLPMKLILNTYLDEPEKTKEVDFELGMGLNDIINIPLLLEKNLEDMVMEQMAAQQVAQQVAQQPSIPPPTLVNEVPTQVVIESIKPVGNTLDNTEINKKILSIIDKENIVLTESNDKIFTKENRDSSSTLKKIVEETINRTNSPANSKAITINSNVRNNIEKDLADSDTLTYNPEDKNELYQEIYSNSEINKERKTHTNLDTINTQEQQELKMKEKFFNNYLNI
jgi:hypothetical protein